MKFYSISIASGIVLFAVGKGIAPVLPEIGAMSNVGALGILGWAVVMLFRANAELRSEITANRTAESLRTEKLVEWLDKAEALRHADSEQLNTAIREQTRHCAETMGKKAL